MNKHNETGKKVYRSIFAIALLFTMLVVTTYALVLSSVSSEGNGFYMGTVKIDLNGGNTIFDGTLNNIDENGNISKNFTVENSGTAEIYYRLYLDNIQGSMAKNVIFEIYDGDKLLYTAPPEKFTKQNPCYGAEPLAAGEVKTLTAVVKLASDDETTAFGRMNFDITADAVQTKNNPERIFD